MDAELKANLDGRVEAITRRTAGLIAPLEQRLGALDERMGALEQRMGALESGLGRLDRRVESLEKQVLAQNTRLDGLSEDMRQRFGVLTDRVAELAA